MIPGYAIQPFAIWLPSKRPPGSFPHYKQNSLQQFMQKAETGALDARSVLSFCFVVRRERFSAELSQMKTNCKE